MDADGIVRALTDDRAKLLSYVCAIVRDHHLADDVLQDVIVLAMERADDIRDREHLLLWSRKAARYKALETLRKQSSRVIALDEDVLELLEADWTNADAQASSEELEHLQACMERLSPHARRILQLRYAEGMTGMQVAAMINVKVGSVYVALSRIHRALEECIERRRDRAEKTNG